MNHKIYKGSTFFMFVMIFSVMMIGTSCTKTEVNTIEVNQTEVISTSNSIQEDLNLNDSNKESSLPSSEEKWIYFDDQNNEGKLYKIALDGQSKLTLPVEDIRDWFIYKDKIIYSTVSDWTKLDELLKEDNTEERTFVNQLKMMNLDGTGQVVIAQDLFPIAFDDFMKPVVEYTPLFVTNNRIYFEITLGKPYSDYRYSYIASINEDLTDAKIVPNFRCSLIGETFLTDKGLYLAERLMGDVNNLYFIDLETGDHHLIQEEINLVGLYKDQLYYMGYHGDEGMKLYKLPINSVETEEVAQLAKFYFLKASNIIGNKLYYKYTKNDDEQTVIIKEIDLDTQMIQDVNENDEECLYTYEENGVLENGQTWHYYIKRNKELNSPEGIGKVNLESGQKMNVIEDAIVKHIQIVSTDSK